MSDSFKLSICTLEGVFFDGQAIEVNLPGSEGRFGVLNKHMNLIANLEPGVVEIKQEEKTSKVVILDGIAEINNEGCTVLVEKAQDKGMDKKALEEALGQAQHDHHKETNPIFKEALEKEIKYLKAIGETF